MIAVFTNELLKYLPDFDEWSRIIIAQRVSFVYAKLCFELRSLHRAGRGCESRECFAPAHDGAFCRNAPSP
jgi:hypothetical protein